MNSLLLDVGNTCLKWAVLEWGWKQSRLGQYGSCRHGGKDVASSLATVWSALPVVDRVLLASVAGAGIDDELQSWVKKTWGLQIERLISPATGSGIVNAYADPDRLGVDRWAALIAARQLSAGPVCVVDCGTAVTIDRLDAEGRHQGGLILPGLAMMMQALSSGAEKLSGDVLTDDVWVTQKVAGLAQDTGSALAAGVLTTLVAAIDRVVNDTDRVNGAAACILTGGDGAMLLPLLAGQWLHRPHLVLEGMAQIAGEME